MHNQNLKKGILFLIPIFALICAFFYNQISKKTIIPLDIYLISKQLYEPGNARKVHNSYMTDTLDVFLPWKYYISQYKPETCTTTISNRLLGDSKTSGFRLPDNFCYPIGAVRPALKFDIFFPLSKILPFFTAYDLSFILLLCTIYGAFFILFYVWTNKSFIISCLCANLALFSSPVSRELQHDWVITSLPWSLVSLTSYIYAIQKKQIGFLWLSFFMLFMSLARSTLQGLGFNLLFYILFALIWSSYQDTEKNQKKYWKIVFCGLFIVLILGIWRNLGSIKLFLNGLDNFLPNNHISFFFAILKRSAAWSLSILHFIFGGLIFSFDTIDFYKIVGNLGARDYPSHDGSTFFISPFISVLTLLLIFKAVKINGKSHRKILKYFFVACLVDFFICISFLYRLFYFRFHQWWMLLAILFLFSELFSDTSKIYFKKKKNILVIAFSCIFLLISFLTISFSKNILLAHLGSNGFLGFEPGFWNWRFQYWLSRISFRDYYSILWAVFGVGCIWLFYKKLWIQLTVVICLSGFFITTFNFNRPQNIAYFEKYREGVKSHGFDMVGMGHEFHENNKLLLNLPVNEIYESLNVKMHK